MLPAAGANPQVPGDARSAAGVNSEKWRDALERGEIEGAVDGNGDAYAAASEGHDAPAAATPHSSRAATTPGGELAARHPAAQFDAGGMVAAGAPRGTVGPVSALEVAANGLLNVWADTSCAQLRFECRIAGGALDGTVLQLSTDAGYDGPATVVVRLPQRHWRSLEARRADLLRALSEAVPGRVAIEVLPDEELDMPRRRRA